MSQGLNRPLHENARTDPETCEPNKDNGLKAPLPRAPQTPTVALPKQEEELEDSDDFSYSGFEPDAGCGLVGSLTMDGNPEVMLDYIDDIFPGLLAMS